MLHFFAKKKGFLALYAATSGVFFSLAFPPKLVYGLEFVALVPILCLVFVPISSKRCFLYAWVAFTTAFTLYLRWYFDILPISWLEADTTPLLVCVVGLTLLLSAGWLAVWPAALLAMSRHFSKKNPSFLIPILMLGWPLFEYLRAVSHSFHPYILGPGTIFGEHWGFMLLGYTIADYPFLRHVASVFGEYGLSFIVLLPNVAFFLLVSYFLSIYSKQKENFTKNFLRHQKLSTAIVCIILFLALSFAGRYFYQKDVQRRHDDLWNIALVQTDIASATIRNDRDRDIWQKNQRQVQQAAKAALTARPEILVLPEGAPGLFDIPQPHILDSQLPDPYPSLAQIREEVGEEQYLLIIDNDLPPSWFDDTHNTTTLLDNQNGFVGTYHKRFLMPWGEYTPFLTDWVSRVFGFYWSAYRFSRIPGETANIFTTPIGTIGLLTCSELVSPKLVRETAKNGADIIIFSSSNAILHGSSQLQHQSLSMAKIHAAALGVPIVYAANSGESFIVDQRGDVLWRGTSSAITPIIANIPR